MTPDRFACGCVLYLDSSDCMDLCPCSEHTRDFVEEYWPEMAEEMRSSGNLLAAFSQMRVTVS